MNEHKGYEMAMKENEARIKEYKKVIRAKDTEIAKLKDMLTANGLLWYKKEKDKEIAQLIAHLKDVISKGTDMKVELLKEIAALKELVREVIDHINCDERIECEDCEDEDCSMKAWLAKAKQALGKGKK